MPAPFSDIERLGLVCPTCRRIEGGAFRVAPLAAEPAGEPLRLRCRDSSCRRAYPIAGGIPVVVRDVAAVVADDPPPPGAEAALHLPWDGPAWRALRETASYGLAHYGDGIEGDLPPPPAPREVAAIEPVFRERVAGAIAKAAAAGEPPSRAIDLGCSAGRFAIEAARHASLAVGIDTHLPPLRLALRAAKDGALDIAVPVEGKRVATVRCRAPRAGPGEVRFLAASALDPPFEAETFDLALALNLFDSVQDPLTLLGQVDGLLRPGGRLVAAAPWSYAATVTAEERWWPPAGEPGGAASHLKRLLSGEAPFGWRLDYEVVDEADPVPWVVRRSGRGYDVLLCQLLVARKR